MGIKVDLSGLEDFAEMLQNAIGEIPEINSEFINDEFEHFKQIAVQKTPKDTGHLAESYKAGEVRQSGTQTEQDWKNTAHYAKFVNSGTVHQAPQYFWEKSENQAKEGREGRYQEKIAELFE